MRIDPPPHNAPADGLRQLIEPPKPALDKAPVLQGIFDRVASSCSAVMRELSTAPCSCMLTGISSGNTRELLEPYETGVGAIFYSQDWDSHVVIGSDRRLAFSIIDAMFGGDGSEPPVEVNRPLAALELSVVRQILIRKASVLQENFSPISRIQLSFDRIETALDLPGIGLSDAPALMAQFIVEVGEQGGRMFMLLPSNPLTAFRNRLKQDSQLQAPTFDPSWSRQLQVELGRAEVDLTAVLEGSQLTLDALSRLRPGQILRLNASPITPITIEIEDRGVFTAKLGQSKGLFTVCVERRIDEREALLADILGD